MYGTHSNSDTLQTYLNDLNLRVTDFGEDNTYTAITELLMAHNAIMDELIDSFCVRTPTEQELYGGVEEFEMADLDEYGVSDAQKLAEGVNLGYPLRKTGATLQWTRTYLMNARLREINAAVEAIMSADEKRVIRDIKRAFMLATNYTFKDRFATNLNIPVKRLLNADGAPVPPSPYGTTFDGATHTHYLAEASLTPTFLNDLVETVLEHNANANIMVGINRAEEATIRTAATFPLFREYVDARIISGADVTRASGDLDRNRIYNRAIGVHGPAEIWVKPWVPANYLVAWDASVKPLRFRHYPSENGSLGIVFEDEAHPLRARGWERNFGVGVRDRHAMAMLKIDNATWSDPSI